MGLNVGEEASESRKKFMSGEELLTLVTLLTPGLALSFAVMICFAKGG